jgi:hypothetical protein
MLFGAGMNELPQLETEFSPALLWPKMLAEWLISTWSCTDFPLSEKSFFPRLKLLKVIAEK